MFQSGDNKALYMLVSPKILPNYIDEMESCCPLHPVIKKENLHNDIVKTIKSLTEVDKNNNRLIQAYIQIIFAHVFSEMEMVKKESLRGNNLVYEIVEYVAQNFREKITLNQMAHDLGMNKYVLSRLFSKTFQCNFTSYVNGIRLNYAVAMLDGTKATITDICYECGFESQRTFNRVFKERYRMTPKEYRNGKQM